VHRIGGGSREPIPRVNRHDRSIKVVVKHRVEEPGDVRERVLVVLIVPVIVTDIVDEHNDVVALTAIVALREAHQLGQVGLIALPVWRRAPPIRFDRVYVVVEQVKQVGDLLVGDYVSDAIVPARGGIKCLELTEVT
jgi:hypothetical protein